MLKTNILRFSLVLALGAFGVACGDEEETATDTGADTGTTDTPTEDTPMEDTPMEDTPMEDTPMEDTPMEDTPMEDTPMEDTPMEDTPMEDTPAEGGACTNDADLAILADGGSDEVTSSAQDCGLGCLADDDPEACAVTCIVDDTGISGPCAGCYGGIVACSIENCLAPCATDPSGEECTTCQTENCVEAFDACTGLGDME